MFLNFGAIWSSQISYTWGYWVSIKGLPSKLELVGDNIQEVRENDRRKLLNLVLQYMREIYKMSGNNQQPTGQLWTSSGWARITKRNGLAIAIGNNSNGKNYLNTRDEFANYLGVTFVVSTMNLLENGNDISTTFVLPILPVAPAGLERHNNTLDLFLAWATTGTVPFVGALDQCTDGILVSKKQQSSNNWEEEFDFDMVDPSILPPSIPVAFGWACGLASNANIVARRLRATDNGPTTSKHDEHYKMVGETNPLEKLFEFLKYFLFRADYMDVPGLGRDQDNLEGNCYNPAPTEEKFRRLTNWEKQSSPRVASSQLAAEGPLTLLKKWTLIGYQVVSTESRSQVLDCNMVPGRHCDKQDPPVERKMMRKMMNLDHSFS